MADFSISAPLREGNQKVLYVWYDGTDALLQGQGVCYHHDYNAPARPQATQIIAAETAASIDFIFYPLQRIAEHPPQFPLLSGHE